MLHRTGLLSLWRNLHAGQISVLTLHSVLEEREQLSWMPLRTYMAAERLDHMLATVGRHHTYVSMDQAAAILAGEAAPVKNAVVVTLDDGYTNNFTVALPLFEKHEVPATFFIVPEKVHSQTPFWFDRFDYAIQHNTETGTRLPILDQEVVVAADDRNALKQSMLRCFRILMDAIEDDQELATVAAATCESIEQLRSQSILDRFDADDPASIVSAERLAALGEHPLCTFGSHTQNHVRVPGLAAQQADEELVRSAREVSALVSKPCHYFCYPNGDYDAQSAKRVGAAGYRLGLTCVDGMNRVGDDPLVLKRINWPNRASDAELLALAGGAYRDWFEFRHRAALTRASST